MLCPCNFKFLYRLRKSTDEKKFNEEFYTPKRTFMQTEEDKLSIIEPIASPDEISREVSTNLETNERKENKLKNLLENKQIIEPKVEEKILPRFNFSAEEFPDLLKVSKSEQNDIPIEQISIPTGNVKKIGKKKKFEVANIDLYKEIEQNQQNLEDKPKSKKGKGKKK